MSPARWFSMASFVRMARWVMFACCVEWTSAWTNSPAMRSRNGNSIRRRRTGFQLMSRRLSRFRFVDQTSEPLSECSRSDFILALGSLALFQRRINRLISTDLVVKPVRPSFYREVRRIDARDAAFTNDNLAEDILVNRDRTREQLVFALV